MEPITTATVLTTLAIAAALLKCTKEGVALWNEWNKGSVKAPKIPSKASENAVKQGQMAMAHAR